MENQELHELKSLITSDDPLAQCKRYRELDKLCYLAVTMEEQGLLGIPKEERSEIPQEYAPYRPENLILWKEAAHLGIPNGCYLFGNFMLNSGEPAEGLCWLKIAASKGNNAAKRTLGEYLLDNNMQDEGLLLLEEAANAGDGCACEKLAHRYEEGDGVQKSKSKFLLYMELAAKFGSRSAMLLLKNVKTKTFDLG